MGVRKHRCNFCEKEYRVLDQLKHHKAQVHGIGQLPKNICYICGGDFSTKANLAKHLNHIHGVFKKKKWKKEDVECPHCNKAISKSTLKRHIKRMHQIEKEFPCSYCEKAYSSNSDLTKHIRFEHLKIRPFRCRLCEKTFQKADHLKLHIGTFHEGLTTEGARKKSSSLGPTHPAFEKLSTEDMTKLYPTTCIKAASSS